MLVFEGTPAPTVQYWQHKDFTNKMECHDYIFQNKVKLVDSILLDFRDYKGKELNGFEFFCEGTTLEEV